MKKLWKYLEGKKRNIGIIAMFALKVTPIIFPDVLSPKAETIIRESIDYFLLSATVDALRRTDESKKIINKALSKININN